MSEKMPTSFPNPSEKRSVYKEKLQAFTAAGMILLGNNAGAEQQAGIYEDFSDGEYDEQIVALAQKAEVPFSGNIYEQLGKELAKISREVPYEIAFSLCTHGDTKELCALGIGDKGKIDNDPVISVTEGHAIDHITLIHTHPLNTVKAYATGEWSEFAYPRKKYGLDKMDDSAIRQQFDMMHEGTLPYVSAPPSLQDVFGVIDREYKEVSKKNGTSYTFGVAGPSNFWTMEIDEDKLGTKENFEEQMKQLSPALMKDEKKQEETYDMFAEYHDMQARTFIPYTIEAMHDDKKLAEEISDRDSYIQKIQELAQNWGVKITHIPQNNTSVAHEEL